jgi:hypothetical protein
MAGGNDPYDLINVKDTGLRKAVPAQEQPPEPEPSKRKPHQVTVSKETREGLDALAGAMKLQREEEAAEEKADPVEEVVKVDLGETPEDATPNYQTIYYRNTPLDNQEVRNRVEKSCSQLNFSDLILEGFVSQEVQVIEGRLRASYRSLLASENLWLEQQASTSETDYNRLEWIGYGRLVLALETINGAVLPSAKDSGGHYTTTTFTEKKAKIMAYPEKVIEVLLVNLAWFEDRVAQLFTNDFEQLKNG